MVREIRVVGNVMLTRIDSVFVDMCASCVRVAREDGEAARRMLAELNILDYTHQIESEDGWLYIPVTATSEVPAEYTIEKRDLPARDQHTTPGDHLSFTPTYERLGDIILVEEPDDTRAEAIKDAILASDFSVRTIVRKASEIRGNKRIRDWDVLFGTETETTHREYGYSYTLDIEEVYFTPRLATERKRVTSQVDPTDKVFDMFAGVGPFTIPMAARGADVIATDINETAIEYLLENAEANDVLEDIHAVAGDVRDIASSYTSWASRIVMNLPHSADEFLATAIQLAADDCVIHYYDIQPEDDPFSHGEARITNMASPEYSVSIDNRRTVRSYSPREVNICLDVTLTTH